MFQRNEEERTKALDCYNKREALKKKKRNQKKKITHWVNQIGEGMFPSGAKGRVFLSYNGRYELHGPNGESLSLPENRVFETRKEEIFFLIFNHRKWYFYRIGDFFFAKYVP